MEGGVGDGDGNGEVHKYPVTQGITRNNNTVV
jgi:hypothetical protein